MNNKIYFKICSIAKDGSFYSLMANTHCEALFDYDKENGFAVEYKIGGKTVPPKNANPFLFVFNSFDLAKDYFNKRKVCWDNIALFSCSIGEIHTTKIDLLDCFPPFGTVLTKEVTLLEKIIV